MEERACFDRYSVYFFNIPFILEGMAIKKKPEVTKTQQKKNLSIYVERYREIELYLTLLSRPLLTAIIPTTSVGSDALFDKVESEIKDFIETKLQVLTGMSKAPTLTGFTDSEVSALRLVASKITTKEPVFVPEDSDTAKASPPPAVVQEEVEPEQEEDEQSFSTPDVVVEKLDSPIAKRKKKASKVVDPSVVPQGVSLDEPTDTMKRAKPAGVKPLPPPDASYQMALAMQQAAAAEQAFGSLQTQQPNNSRVNLDEPFFR